MCVCVCVCVVPKRGAICGLTITTIKQIMLSAKIPTSLPTVDHNVVMLSMRPFEAALSCINTAPLCANIAALATETLARPTPTRPSHCL